MDQPRISLAASTWKTVIALGSLAVLVVTFLVADIAWNAGVNRPTKAVAAAAVAPRVAHVNLTIVTGRGPKGDWPAFVPADFTMPANATVVFTIVDLDDATALPATYAKVSGTVGNTIQVAPIDPASPNSAGAAKTVSALDPTIEVGHTFTIPGLGINVPVAAHSVETFTIHTAATDPCTGGACMWHCYDPCGSGPSGWTGPMAAAGFMGGTVTVTA
jgi:hypothetical protein